MIIVTIGLCVKNGEVTVGKTVQSIINQDYPFNSIELIVVDGKSTDKTASIIIDTLLTSDIQTRTFSDQGKGLGEARQIVVDNARGEYIVWVDADVVIPRTYVRQQVEFMNENPRVGAAQGKVGIYASKRLVEVLENFSVFENKH